jgi:hypothetical protein
MIPPDRIDRVTQWWEDLDPKQRQALLEHPAVKVRLGATFALTERQREAELLLDGPATSVLLWADREAARRR